MYENILFDSFPELCFYLYHIENNIDIIREPCQIKYTYNNKEYVYVPDFQIANELIEIKGDQFIKPDGTWQNPFCHEDDALIESKHQCAIENNVKILTKKDYQKYIDWFNFQGYEKSAFRKNKTLNK